MCIRDSSKYGKAFVHLPAASTSVQRGADNRPLLTLMSPKLLIRMYIFLSDMDIYRLACCDKRSLLWTSCPVLWGAKASSLAQNIEPMLKLIHTTSEAYEDYKRVRSDLILIPPAYIEDIRKLGKPERIVRDVVAICGLFLYPHADPFSGIRTKLVIPDCALVRCVDPLGEGCCCFAVNTDFVWVQMFVL